MKKYVILLMLLLPLVACSKKQDGQVVATIDGDKVTAADFNNELDKIPMNMKMLVANQSGKRNFLDRMVVQRLLLKEAKKEDIQKSKDFQDKLSEFKDQLTIQSLLAKKIMTDSKASDETSKFYDADKEEFKKEREIQTRQIVVKTEQEARELQAKGSQKARTLRNWRRSIPSTRAPRRTGET